MRCGVASFANALLPYGLSILLLALPVKLARAIS